MVRRLAASFLVLACGYLTGCNGAPSPVRTRTVASRSERVDTEALTQFVSDGFQTKPPFAALADADDYYSASLKLLSNIAAGEAPLARRT